MTDTDPRGPFLDAVGELGPALLGSLDALEQAARRLHPPAIRMLRQALGPLRDRLEEALDGVREVAAPGALQDLQTQLVEAGVHALAAVRGIAETGPPDQGIERILGAMHEHCQAQEKLYPLRRALPPVSRFFLEPALQDRVDEFDPEPAEGARVGLFHANNDVGARGGFSLYVPESIAPGEARPLIVALHGGSGHGRDFLWTWLREARGRRCLLLAPTSQGPTWALNGPDVDAPNLRKMVEFVNERWPIDRDHVLLTGLSDGATYSLLCGLQPDMPYTALAPVSGVMHPANFANGNIGRARGVPIYLVHGALDWMFPVQVARMAHEELQKAGADVTYREIDDLSHTYPREENARILEWMDPALAIPEL